jgi:hypothetical protein
MKTIFLSFLCVIMLTGCNDDNNTTTPFEPVTITPVLIGKGFNSINIAPGNLVISNQADWDAFLISMGYYSSFFINTPVDFSLYEVIAIVDSMRPDTGHSVNIDTVTENENDISVDFSVLNSGDGYTVMGQPYHIVKIPRLPKPVIFQ